MWNGSALFVRTTSNLEALPIIVVRLSSIFLTFSPHASLLSRICWISSHPSQPAPTPLHQARHKRRTDFIFVSLSQSSPCLLHQTNLLQKNQLWWKGEGCAHLGSTEQFPHTKKTTKCFIYRFLSARPPTSQCQTL